MKTLGIVGGQGKMAQWFIRQFRSAFHTIVSFDLESREPLESFVKKADLFLISVPISETVSVIEEMGRFISKNQFLMDFASLKEAPCHAMRSLCCPTLGLHPLFGPQVTDLSECTIVFCETQKNTWIEKIRALFESQSIRVLKMDPQEHDQKMAYIQALNHGLQLIYGDTLAKEGLEELISLKTPSFSLFVRGLENLLRQDAKLYRSIAFENPYFLPVLKRFQKVFNQYLEIIEEKNEKGFDQLFHRLKHELIHPEVL